MGSNFASQKTTREGKTADTKRHYYQTHFLQPSPLHECHLLRGVCLRFRCEKLSMFKILTLLGKGLPPSSPAPAGWWLSWPVEASSQPSRVVRNGSHASQSACLLAASSRQGPLMVLGLSFLEMWNQPHVPRMLIPWKIYVTHVRIILPKAARQPP